MDLLRDAEGGLLAWALRVGLQTLQEMLAAEVDALVGPKGQHNPHRTAVRHGIEDGYVYVGARKMPVRHPRVRTTGGDEVLYPRTKPSKTPPWSPKPCWSGCCLGEPVANSSTQTPPSTPSSRRILRTKAPFEDAFVITA